MRIEPSGIDGVELCGPGSDTFKAALLALGQADPDPALRAALPWSVVVSNRTMRPISLLGVRFDMMGRSGKPYSVVQYADMLRQPGHSVIAADGVRMLCAEPFYSELVRGRQPDSPEAAERARMNIENLSQARNPRASIDCIAFDDGEFLGPDSRGAWDRLATEREAEATLIESVTSTAHPGKWLEQELKKSTSVRPRRILAARLKVLFDTESEAAAVECARGHRLRIALWRHRPNLKRD